MAVVVPILTEFDARGLDRANRGLKNLGDESGRSSALMKAGMLGAGAAIAGVAVALKAAVGAAIEDQKSQALLAKTLETSAGATKAQVAGVEEWITATSRAAAITDDRLRPSLAALTRATGDVSEAQKLQALALDISAGSGKSLEVVTAALVKASNGQVGALKKLGVPLDESIIKTKDFDAAQKALATTFEGAAATSAQTLSGQMAGLTIVMDEAKEQIGAAFIPVLMKLLPIVAAAARVMAEWVPKIIAVVAAIIEKLQPAISRIVDHLKLVVEFVRALIDGEWADAWQALLAVVRSSLNLLGDLLKSVVPFMFNLALDIGEAIVRGMIRGAAALAGMLRDTLVKIAKDAFEAAKDFLGIGSPSKLFEGLGADVTRGFAAGIASIAVPSIAVPAIVGASSSSGAAASSINITVNAGIGADGDGIGRAVVRALQQYARQNGAIPIRFTG